jgi:hypothetical protein
MEVSPTKKRRRREEEEEEEDSVTRLPTGWKNRLRGTQETASGTKACSAPALAFREALSYDARPTDKPP